MTTYAHAIVNTALFTRKKDRPRYYIYAILSGIIPDITMFVFTVYEGWVKKVPSLELWGEKYYEPHWQTSFDVLNSIPLTLVLLGVGIILYKRKSIRSISILGAGMLIHQISDFFLHTDDGHGHFFPFSDFVFQSPVSYWDPRFWGTWAALAEGIIMTIAMIIIIKKVRTKKMRILLWIGTILLLILHVISIVSVRLFFTDTHLT